MNEEDIVKKDLDMVCSKTLSWVKMDSSQLLPPLRSPIRALLVYRVPNLPL